MAGPSGSNANFGLRTQRRPRLNHGSRFYRKSDESESMRRESILGKTLSIWICVLITGSTCNMGFAQPWSAPVALTDSICDNTNCTIFSNPTGSQFEPMVFWEKRLGAGNTSIYSCRLSGDSPPQLVLSAEDVDLRNPQVFPPWMPHPITLSFMKPMRTGMSTFTLRSTFGRGDIQNLSPWPRPTKMKRT